MIPLYHPSRVVKNYQTECYKHTLTTTPVLVLVPDSSRCYLRVSINGEAISGTCLLFPEGQTVNGVTIPVSPSSFLELWHERHTAMVALGWYAFASSGSLDIAVIVVRDTSLQTREQVNATRNGIQPNTRWRNLRKLPNPEKQS